MNSRTGALLSPSAGQVEVRGGGGGVGGVKAGKEEL